MKTLQAEKTELLAQIEILIEQYANCVDDLTQHFYRNQLDNLFYRLGELEFRIYDAT